MIFSVVSLELFHALSLSFSDLSSFVSCSLTKQAMLENRFVSLSILLHCFMSVALKSSFFLGNDLASLVANGPQRRAAPSIAT